MSFLGRVFRFLFWVLIVSWAVKLLGRAFAGPRQQVAGEGSGAAGAEPKAQRLVKDPVCGVHVAQELALPAVANGETHYFCSAECRAKFESTMVRRASA